MGRLDPRELYLLEPDRPEMRDPVLIQALDGFIDAGAATKLAAAHLRESLGSTTLVRFDHDQLHDYRARRPPMQFSRDHWESYDAPELAIHLLRDVQGTAFLLLTGPEPDVQWERFVAAVEQLVVSLKVRLTVGLNAIPMSLPHTRPVGVIAHSNRPELIAGYEPWVGDVTVPGSAGHLLEFRLGEAGHDSMGFAAHVPHYVSQAAYPAAAAALVREVSARTGLVLPTSALDEAAQETAALIDEQVSQSGEIATVVKALEEQYDAFVAGRDKSLLASGDNLPTADELGAELERFLAEQSRGDGTNPS